MKHSIQLGSLTTINIVFLFLFQWYLLIHLGAGIETDAFFAGTTVPQLILVVISSSLTNVLIPLLSNQHGDEQRLDAWGFFFIIGCLFILVAIFLYVLAPWWVPITVPGFTEEGKALTLTLARIQLIGMVFASVTSVQYAASHAKQRFLWAESTLAISNIFALLLLAWTLPVFGIVAAAWIGVLRVALQVLLLIPSMGQLELPNLKRPAIRLALKRIKPLLIGTTYYKTGPLVDRYLLSMGANGSLSLYYLAYQVYAAVSQVLIKALISPMLPVLSKLDHSGDIKTFKNRYHRRLIQLCIISASIIFFLFVLGKPTINALLAYENINPNDVEKLWFILISLSGMFFGGVIGQLTTSAFYASGDTTTVTLMAMITYTVNLPAKIIAFQMFGIKGLAISTSIYLLINMMLLIYLFEKTKPSMRIN